METNLNLAFHLLFYKSLLCLNPFIHFSGQTLNFLEFLLDQAGGKIKILLKRRLEQEEEEAEDEEEEERMAPRGHVTKGWNYQATSGNVHEFRVVSYGGRPMEVEYGGRYCVRGVIVVVVVIVSVIVREERRFSARFFNHGVCACKIIRYQFRHQCI